MTINYDKLVVGRVISSLDQTCLCSHLLSAVAWTALNAGHILDDYQAFTSFKNEEDFRIKRTSGAMQSSIESDITRPPCKLFTRFLLVGLDVSACESVTPQKYQEEHPFICNMKYLTFFTEQWRSYYIFNILICSVDVQRSQHRRLPRTRLLWFAVELLCIKLLYPLSVQSSLSRHKTTHLLFVVTILKRWLHRHRISQILKWSNVTSVEKEI